MSRKNDLGPARWRSRRLVRNRGVFLLEAMIAVTILAVTMAGLAILLSRCMDSVKTLRKDAGLRDALENRLAELTREHLTAGPTRFPYANGKIVVEQEIEADPFHGKNKPELADLYEVKLTAAYPEGGWPPLKILRVIYRPPQ